MYYWMNYKTLPTWICIISTRLKGSDNDLPLAARWGHISYSLPSKKTVFLDKDMDTPEGKKMRAAALIPENGPQPTVW